MFNFSQYSMRQCQMQQKSKEKQNSNSRKQYLQLQFVAILTFDRIATHTHAHSNRMHFIFNSIVCLYAGDCTRARSRAYLYTYTRLYSRLILYTMIHLIIFCVYFVCFVCALYVIYARRNHFQCSSSKSHKSQQQIQNVCTNQHNEACNANMVCQSAVVVHRKSVLILNEHGNHRK